jgi:Schlafen, AlbA_2
MVEGSRRRSITDDEISIIKAMLRRGIGKTEILSYFTRPDRPINFGRITNIDTGEYGPNVVGASESELDRFLVSWAESQGKTTTDLAAAIFDPQSLSPVHPNRLGLLFRKEAKIGWIVAPGETDEIECKESFNVSGRVLRTVAAFANNRGGYILFGVRDTGQRVIGLKNNKFESTDISRISQWIRASLEPIPRFERSAFKVGNTQVGVIYIHPIHEWPVIATKTTDGLHTGTIYFRYPGESRPIEPSELRNMLSQRDGRARREAGKSVIRTLELGPNAGILDLDSGRVEGKSGSFVIDENLLSKVDFIREGSFVDTGGKPTLKVIGDVYAVESGTPSPQHIPEGITDDDVLVAFLKQENVLSPLEFVTHGCHSAKVWLPIHYFIQKSSIDLEAALKTIEAEEPSNRGSKDKLLKRLRGELSAYRPAQGRSEEILDFLYDHKIEAPDNSQEWYPIFYAIGGFEEKPSNTNGIFNLLNEGRLYIRKHIQPSNYAIRSAFNRACCRFDEVLFDPREN